MGIRKINLVDNNNDAIKKAIKENDDLIKEEDFDFLGLIKISNNKGIEKLVSKIKNNLYISRSSEYYKKKTYNELVDFREQLRMFLMNHYHYLPIKKTFIICEYMLNVSYRIFYEDYKSSLDGYVDNNLKISQKCLELDVKNIVNCLKNKIIRPTDCSLKKIEKNIYVENRFIEGDHKMLLYKLVNKLKDINYVVCPLYSAILIGPFFKFLHKISYSYVKFGIHGQGMKEIYDKGGLKLENITITKNFPKKITIIDNNVGSGLTLTILQNLFNKNGISNKIGALEISYEYMEKNNDFSIISKLDYLSYISTRYHGITENLIDKLCNNSKFSGNDYMKSLKDYGFQNEFITDIELLFNRGKSICDINNIKINSFINYDSNLVLSMDIMNGKIRYLENYSVDKAISIIRDFPIVNIIDLDKFRKNKWNIDIIKKIIKLKKVRVGGGIRTKEEIQKLIGLGVDKVIVGTYASPELLECFSSEKILVGLDSIDRKTNKKVDIYKKISLFERYCSEFNFVSVENDGKAKGGDIKSAIKYSKLTKNKFNCVGGINNKKEMDRLKKYNIGCTIGRKIQEGYFA